MNINVSQLLSDTASTPYQEKELITEIEADVTKTLEAIGSNHNVVVLDLSYKETDAFSRSLTERCRKSSIFPKTIAFCIDMFWVFSITDFAKHWMAAVLAAVSSNPSDMKANAETYLSKYRYEELSRTDKPGVVHQFIIVQMRDKVIKKAKEFFHITEKICREKGVHLIACLKNMHTLEYTQGGADIISLIRKDLWPQDHITVVPISNKKEFHTSLLKGVESTECESLELTPLSKESFKKTIYTHVQSKCPTITEECLDFIWDFFGPKIDRALEFVDDLMEWSNRELSMTSIRAYLTFTMHSYQEEFGKDQLNPKERCALKLLGNADVFTEILLKESISEKKKMSVEKSLIKNRILYEGESGVELSDTFYPCWIKYWDPIKDYWRTNHNVGKSSQKINSSSSHGPISIEMVSSIPAHLN